MADDPITRARLLADHLRAQGHEQQADHVHRTLESRVGDALLTALRETCQTVLTAIEAIDPVSATMIDELRLEVDKRLPPHH